MANNQVVLEFVGDTKGLQDAIASIDKLDKSISRMAASSASFKKLNDEMAKWGKAAKAQQGQIGQLAEAHEELTKSIADGAFDEVAKQFVEFGKSIEAAKELLALLRAEMDEMAVSAQEGSERFQQMKESADELGEYISNVGDRTKELAEDTKVLEGVKAVVEGVVGAYAAFYGTMGLVKAESRDLKEALDKANAAIAVLDEIQKYANLANKDSAAYLLAQAAAQKLATLHTKAAALAEKEGVVAKYAGAAAMRVLNLAMKANPVFLLIGGVTALIGALAIFNKVTDTAAEKQQKLNTELETQLKFNKIIAQGFTNLYAEDIRSLEEEIALLKAKGALVDDINMAEERLANKKKKIAKDQLQYFQEEIKFFRNSEKSWEEMTKQEVKVLELHQRVDNLRNAGYDSKADEIEKELKAEQAYLDILVDKWETGKKALETYSSTVAEAAEKERERFELLRRDSKATFEVELLAAENSYAAQFKAKKELLYNEKEIAINAANLTGKEKELIEAQYVQKLKELNAEYNQQVLEEAKRNIDIKLLQAEEGSREELELKIEALRKERDIELASIKLTATQRKLIIAQALQEEIDLKEAYNNAAIMSQLNAEMSYLKIKEAMATENSAEMLKAQIDIIEKQADIERTNAINTITNKEELDAKLKEINANTDKQILDAKKQHNKHLETLRNNAIAAETKHEIAKLELVKNNLQLTEREREEAEAKIYDQQLLGIRKQQNSLDISYDQGLISYDEYLQQRRALEDEYNAISQQKKNDAFEKDKAREEQWRQFAMETAQTVLDTAFAIGTERRQAAFEEEMKGITEQKETAMAALEEAKENDLISEEAYQARRQAIEDKYKKQEAQTKARQFDAEKRAKIAQAVMNGALAVTNILATVPAGPLNPAAIVAIAGAAITTAAQVALIASQKPPQYAKGTPGAEKTLPGFKWVGEQGPELIWTPGGEKIMTHTDSLALMDKYQIPALASHVTMPQLPLINKQVVADYERNATVGIMPSFNIDYDLLASKMGREMEKHPRTVITIDKGGFSSALISKGKRINSLNNRMQS